MSKITKILMAFKLIIQKPYLLNLIIDSEEEKQKYVSRKYNLPDGLPTVNISEFVSDYEEINPCSFLEGSSLPTDFALLRGICKHNHVEDYLEIGTWRGESVANVAPLVKNCYTINLPDETMRQMGLDEDYINMHRFFSKDISNITHIQADSQTFDFSSLNKKFDLIFIDGDHHSESICKDTQNAFSLLKDDNSVIVWHDYGYGTETTRFNVLAGMLDGCPKDKIKHLYRVSHTLCAIYTSKPVNSDYVKVNSPPQNSFELTIKKRK